MYPCCGKRGLDGPVTHPPATGVLRIGGYAVGVGPSTESFAEFEPERDDDSARALAGALAEEPTESPFVEAVEELHETAEGVTARVERADELVRAAAAGHLLDLDTLSGEIDSLLGLLGRLDRAGRFEEQLRLARALHGLLMLSRRWLDLVRALRSTLKAAQLTGSQPGQAWALHELGSLHLFAGAPKVAAKHLGEALRLEQSLGAATGSCATRHNYDCARREAALRAAAQPLPHRLLRLAGLVAVLAILGGGGTAIALAVGDDHHDTAAGPTSSALPTTDAPTTIPPTSSPADTVAPSVRLTAPGDGTTIAISTPEFSGAAGSDPGDEASVQVIVLDGVGGPVSGSPFSATVDGGTWSFTPTVALADGLYSASAQQKDNAGNTGTSSANRFIIDTIAPTLILDCPATLVSNPNVCTLTSSDAGTVRIDVYEVLLDADGRSSEKLLPVSPSIEVQADDRTEAAVNLPELERNGVAFRLVAVQTDPAGNEGQSNSERIERDQSVD
jgi:Big-like domain-containing protein